MSASVMLITDRPGFEPVWRPALAQAGLSSQACGPAELPSVARRGLAVVIDGGCSAYDEDELLSSVGTARAVGAVVAVRLPDGESMSSLDDLLCDMCGGLVARTNRDVAPVAALLARRLDVDRGQRFEFVTVAPRGGGLLAVLGDGRCMLLGRPVGEGDDGTEVVSITLAADASSASVELGSGRHVVLQAQSAQSSAPQQTEGRAGNGIPIDGSRLGARLRELRLAAGLTQAELARRTGIHRPNIARVEAGRHTPSLETLARLATAIGVPTTRVLTGD